MADFARNRGRLAAGYGPQRSMQNQILVSLFTCVSRGASHRFRPDLFILLVVPTALLFAFVRVIASIWRRVFTPA